MRRDKGRTGGVDTETHPARHARLPVGRRDLNARDVNEATGVLAVRGFNQDEASARDAWDDVSGTKTALCVPALGVAAGRRRVLRMASALPLSVPGITWVSRVLQGLGAAGLLRVSAAQAATSAASTSAASTSASSTSPEPATAPSARPRLVSVGAGTTEIVYALGAQAQLVGVDTSSLYPAVAQALPKVGYQRTLTAEGVMSLAPQVLLASQDAGPPAVLAQVAAAGVTVVRVDGAYSFEGLLQRIGQVASATGRLDEGEKLSVALAARWADVMAQVDGKPLRTRSGKIASVAFLMRHGPTVVAAGRGTGADAILRLAGARNAFGDAFESYKPLSAEALAQAAPDVIIGTYDGVLKPGDTDALKALPGVALTPAGRSGAIRSFDIVLLLGFGPRLPEAVEALHQGLLQAVSVPGQGAAPTSRRMEGRPAAQSTAPSVAPSPSASAAPSPAGFAASPR